MARRMIPARTISTIPQVPKPDPAGGDEVTVAYTVEFVFTPS